MNSDPTSRDNHLARAVLELGIDVPVARFEPEGDGLVLYLYGGRRLWWKPEPVDHTPLPPVGGDTEGGDNLTRIPGVGPATAKALNAAGFFTFNDLAAASDEALRSADNVTAYTVRRIRDYLYVSGYA